MIPILIHNLIDMLIHSVIHILIPICASHFDSHFDSHVLQTALDECFVGARSEAKKKIFILTDGSYRASAQPEMTQQVRH